MRRLVILGLAVTLSGCGTVLREATQPNGRPSPLGVLVPSVQGRCGTILVGSSTKRVCAPPSVDRDSVAADTVVTQ